MKNTLNYTDYSLEGKSGCGTIGQPNEWWKICLLV